MRLGAILQAIYACAILICHASSQRVGASVAGGNALATAVTARPRKLSSSTCVHETSILLNDTAVSSTLATYFSSWSADSKGQVSRHMHSTDSMPGSFSACAAGKLRPRCFRRSCIKLPVSLFCCKRGLVFYAGHKHNLAIV